MNFFYIWKTSARGLYLPAMMLVLLFAGGCGPDVVETELPDGQQNLRYIVMAYGQFASSYGRPPKTLEDLRPVLKDFGDFEKLTHSPRDGQPYVLVAGINLQQVQPNALPVLAYEAKGVNGKRQVADLRSVSEMTPEEFKRIIFPPSHKPTSD